MSPLPLMGNSKMRPDTEYCPVTSILGTVTSWLMCCLSKSYLEKQSWDEGMNETSCNVIILFYGMTPYSLVVGTSIKIEEKNNICMFGVGESETEKLIP